MADSLVEDLDPASALSGTEQIYGYQSPDDVYITAEQVGDYVLARADTAELVRDTIGATLVAGTNVTITVDDSPNTITISSSGSGSGDVTGPASSTDNAIARYDGTTGKLLQNSGASVDDSGNIAATNLSGTNTGDQTSIVGISGTKSQFDTACSDGNFLYVGDVTQYTDEMAQDAVGNILADTNDIDLSYSDATPSISATLLSTAITAKTAVTPDSADYIIVSDTSDSGNLKKALISDLPGGSGSGDVVGPASATDNALARYDSTTGKLIQNSGVIVDDSNNITGVGTLASGNQTITGTEVITSSGAAAFAVGANGATNPAFAVNASAASSATGLVVASGSAAGLVTTLTATSSDSNCSIRISGKGTGAVSLQVGAQNVIQANSSQCTFTPLTRSSTAVAAFPFTLPTGSSLTASTESSGMDVNLSATQTHSTGAITTQRDMRVRNATHAFAASSTITDAATLSADAAPIAGTNATITNSSAFYSAGTNVGAGVTNSYGINVTANSGATNNYAAKFTGAIDLAGAGAGTAGQVWTSGGAGANCTWSTPSGTGDVVGPASATDNAIARYDSTTGKLLQNSGATIDDSGNLTANNVSGTNTGDQNLFRTIAVSGQSDVVADSTTDTLTLVAGTNITITTDAGTDSVTITASGGSGDVTKVGTPANNQVGVWTGDGTIEGDSAFTFDTATDRLSVTTSGIVETGTIELGNASDTTLARSGAGDMTIEGNAVYRAGGTDVPIADGGTGASTAAAARTNLGVMNIVVLASDVTNNNAVANTIEDITGLSFSVTAGETYYFHFVLDVTTAATTTGYRFAVNGPAATRLSYRAIYPTAATTQSINHGLTSYDLPASSSTASAATGGNIAVIEGFVTPSASGTLIGRFASEVSSSAVTVKAGSILEWYRCL